jgi:hypothetical protein
MSTMIWEGEIAWCDSSANNGRTVKFRGKDQNGQTFSCPIENLFLKISPYNPGFPGNRVKITIEQN